MTIEMFDICSLTSAAEDFHRFYNTSLEASCWQAISDEGVGTGVTFVDLRSISVHSRERLAFRTSQIDVFSNDRFSINAKVVFTSILKH